MPTIVPDQVPSGDAAFLTVDGDCATTPLKKISAAREAKSFIICLFRYLTKKDIGIRHRHYSHDQDHSDKDGMHCSLGQDPAQQGQQYPSGQPDPGSQLMRFAPDNLILQCPRRPDADKIIWLHIIEKVTQIGKE